MLYSNTNVDTHNILTHKGTRGGEEIKKNSNIPLLSVSSNTKVKWITVLVVIKIQPQRTVLPVVMYCIRRIATVFHSVSPGSEQ